MGNSRFKFRAKHIDTGRWFYGDLINNEIHACCIVLVKAGSVHQIPVDPKTVGQFTTKKDDAGNEIFEHDILGTDDEDNQISQIKWDESSCSLVDSVDGDLSMLEKTCVVIGNIHDNPELLKKDWEL